MSEIPPVSQISQTSGHESRSTAVMGKIAGLVLGLTLLLTTAVTAGAQKGDRRVALVIGNGSYLHNAFLPNPPNDGRAVSRVLRKLGFQVAEVIDADKPKMDGEIQRFKSLLRSADVSLFFYSGHGLQIDGENYLVPINASFHDNSDISSQLIGLSGIISAIGNGPKVNLVFLDACRNNPMADLLKTKISQNRGITIDGTHIASDVGQGLAEMKGVVGSLIAYATAPDNVAEDGTGENSPFTSAFLKYIEEPGLEVRQFLTRVRLDVLEETEQRQVPWDQSSLTELFYFKAPEKAKPIPLPPP